MSRETFDREAERYDRIRPGYPDRLFDDLASLGGLPPNGRILEIGVGTGRPPLPCWNVATTSPAWNLVRTWLSSPVDGSPGSGTE